MLGEGNEGCIKKAASFLTPFVTSVFEGKEYLPRLHVELIDKVSLPSIGIEQAIQLLSPDTSAEVANDNDS